MSFKIEWKKLQRKFRKALHIGREKVEAEIGDKVQAFAKFIPEAVTVFINTNPDDPIQSAKAIAELEARITIALPDVPDAIRDKLVRTVLTFRARSRCAGRKAERRDWHSRRRESIRKEDFYLTIRQLVR